MRFRAFDAESHTLFTGELADVEAWLREWEYTYTRVTFANPEFPIAEWSGIDLSDHPHTVYVQAMA